MIVCAAKQIVSGSIGKVAGKRLRTSRTILQAAAERFSRKSSIFSDLGLAIAPAARKGVFH
jgi:hypothetical protein